MSDLKSDLLDQLMEDEGFKLYLRSHYVIEYEKSYIPLLSGERLYFRSRFIVVKKKIGILGKIRYYISDFILYLRGGRSEPRRSKGKED